MVSRAEGQAYPLWVYILLFLVCQVVVTILYNAWKRKQNEKDKKFI